MLLYVYKELNTCILYVYTSIYIYILYYMYTNHTYTKLILNKLM